MKKSERVNAGQKAARRTTAGGFNSVGTRSFPLIERIFRKMIDRRGACTSANSVYARNSAYCLGVISHFGLPVGPAKVTLPELQAAMSDGLAIL